MTSSVELGLTVSANKNLPEAWDYYESVDKVRSLITSFKTVSTDMLHELWVAREKLSPRSPGKIDVTNVTWNSYCDDVGIERMTAHRWLNQYDPVERKKIEKPKPTPEEIQHKKESQERMAGHIEEDRKLKKESKIYVSDEVEDLIDEAKQSIKTASEVAELSLNGNVENLAQTDIFTSIDRYVYSFGGVSRQLEAVQNIIKKLRRMANSLQVKS